MSFTSTGNMPQLPDELRDQLDHCGGYGCTCYAAYSGECGCWADWRSENEVVMDWMLEHPETMHEVLDAWAYEERNEAVRAAMTKEDAR